MNYVNFQCHFVSELSRTQIKVQSRTWVALTFGISTFLLPFHSTHRQFIQKKRRK
jgi:hypothetical protein